MHDTTFRVHVVYRHATLYLQSLPLLVLSLLFGSVLPWGLIAIPGTLFALLFWRYQFRSARVTADTVVIERFLTKLTIPKELITAWPVGPLGFVVKVGYDEYRAAGIYVAGAQRRRFDELMAHWGEDHIVPGRKVEKSRMALTGREWITVSVVAAVQIAMWVLVYVQSLG